MIRVLHVTSSVGMPGGVQSMLWNYYSRMNPDEVMFDFIVHNQRMEGFEQNFLNKGSQIFYVPPKREGVFKHIRKLKKVMRATHYDAVHVHQDFLGYLSLLAAKQCHIKVRIVHTHKANLRESLLKKLNHRVLGFIVKKVATDFFACGQEAAVWTYGRDFVSKGKVTILHNAIVSERFLFDAQKRERMRSELGLNDAFVIGNVARFTYQKNHSLLLKVFAEIKKVKNNAVLLCVGDGELFEETKQEARELGVYQDVLFLGARNDADALIQAMDVFVLTSRFEGLPVTMVEAQTADLPCIVSDNITHEIDINGRTQYVKLSDPIDYWVQAVIRSNREDARRDMYATVCAAGYDITHEAAKLTKMYVDMVKRADKR